MKDQLVILVIALVLQKTNFVLALVNQRQNFAYIAMMKRVMLPVNKTETCKFKVNDNISWYNFCLGSVPEDFFKDQTIEIYCI